MNIKGYKLSAKAFLIFLILFAFASVMVGAQEIDDFGSDDFGSDDSLAIPGEDALQTEESAPVKMSEQQLVEDLINRHKPFFSDKDPFKPIIEKKVVLPPVRTVKPRTAKAAPVKAAPPVEPIKLYVQGIVGDDVRKLAIVRFKNKEYTVEKEMIVDGQFKVIDIQNDRVIVYSNKEQRRHTFKIGGDDKK